MEYSSASSGESLRKYQPTARYRSLVGAHSTGYVRLRSSGPKGKAAITASRRRAGEGGDVRTRV